MNHLNAFTLLLLLLPLNLIAQQDKKQLEVAQEVIIKRLVESQTFVFHGEKVAPLEGNLIHLTPGYVVRVKPDGIYCDLPYFGKASMASLDQTNYGYKFESARFDYSTKSRKKGGWDITLKTKDVRYAPQLYFIIQPSGAANLRINSNDRQSISYLGTIEQN
jgi:hypothetical protein